ncbi:VOC family protein [Ferdinandcohnia quinoae]|uniref:VOC family protein n=1 Tax=Fredinandcohnia quinoae TaxID=2918902 RepID=A0AAW5DVG9_9BACI|nr:VOC family protein [Fredinandcohnia sp. SECRCQ15]MCH1624028.1 VOC family protein [Fredinandcohnia sp. SECRCQ15]
MKLQAIPYILMNGRAREAIEFYRNVLNADILFQSSIGDRPKDIASQFLEIEQELIAHAVLKIGETQIMISDILTGIPSIDGGKISICLIIEGVASSQRIFNQLKVGGTVNLDLAKTHYSPAYGIVTDKFGVTFQISTQ